MEENPDEKELEQKTMWANIALYENTLDNRKKQKTSAHTTCSESFHDHVLLRRKIARHNHVAMTRHRLWNVIFAPSIIHLLSLSCEKTSVASTAIYYARQYVAECSESDFLISWRYSIYTVGITSSMQLNWCTRVEWIRLCFYIIQRWPPLEAKSLAMTGNQLAAYTRVHRKHKI